MSDKQARLERLTSMLRRRGVILPAFEIHGGVAGLFDFGPVGGRLRRRLNNTWLEHWTSQGNIVEIDSPTITPESVLIASGHVGEFNDHMSECVSCGGAFRSDHLITDLHPNPDILTATEIDNLIRSSGVTCPTCGTGDWKDARPMNLMFDTRIGAMKGGRTAYMRPETAQGMFMQFPALYRHFRNRLPFGAVQTGKGYRNEISPRQGMIRLREFNMAELEYFIDPDVNEQHDFSPWSAIQFNLVPDPESGQPVQMTPGDAAEQNVIRHPTVAWFMARTWDFLTSVGIDPDRIRFRQHEGTEMAHYASDCWDAEIDGSYGWIECVGIAHRGCYDLQAHETATGDKNLRAWRPYEKPKEVDRTILSGKGAIIGPAFRDKAGLVNSALESLEIPTQYPFQLELSDGTQVTIEESMVEQKRIQTTEHGEWFLPHVVEPAFGIDRILWHVLDHAYHEIDKGDEAYTVMRIRPNIAPIDIAVLPLMEKSGLEAIARDVHERICAAPNLVSYYDGSGSIGRRYARADEVGVPWAITVDHDTLEDQTVTIRRRDDGQQIRISIDEITDLLITGGISSRF
ncbi:MAG: glycine--tRNA ligase [Candidatus Thermoplasmatota archaeon]|nr:glycine--tRNA ligase [Candidatus Thermoplasmatota archaeon]